MNVAAYTTRTTRVDMSKTYESKDVTYDQHTAQEVLRGLTLELSGRCRDKV